MTTWATSWRKILEKPFIEKCALVWRGLSFTRNEWSFYHKCYHALRVLAQLQTGCSQVGHIKPWWREEGLFTVIWSISCAWQRRRVTWGPRLRYLNNNKASLTWLVIWNAFWVSKKLFTACLVVLPECIQCGDMEGSILYTYFHCLVVQPLCKFLEGYMVCILNGKFFVLEASSVCSNMVPSQNRSEHYVFLCLNISTWSWENWTKKASIFLKIFGQHIVFMDKSHLHQKLFKIKQWNLLVNIMESFKEKKENRPHHLSLFKNELDLSKNWKKILTVK